MKCNNYDISSCCSSTFNPDTKGEQLSHCVDCTAGYYCPNMEMHTPLPCGRGYYSASGASICTECEPGFYCDTNTTSQTFMMTERYCPAGQECAAGSVTQPDLVGEAGRR